MLSQGIVLSNRYVLTERIATGGMGDVWRANDVLLKREVAVKVLLPSLVADLDFITRFRAEAQMMAALRHPGIVGVFDVGDATLDAGVRVDYLVMQYVYGQPLSSQIKAAGQLSAAETMSVVAQAAEALDAAHAAGIIHRDVKPSNLLVQPDGSVVLVDFGIARSINMTGITSTNVVLGTALYMAPEQVDGRPVSPATDIYALGVVAYCCLAGRPPFTDPNPLEVANRHLRDEPPALPAETPGQVATVIARALAKDPSDRYPSAADFADAARAALSNAPTVPRAQTRPAPGRAVPGGAAPVLPNPSQIDQPTRRTGQPRRIAVGVIAAVAAIAVMGLVTAFVFRPWAGQASQPTAATKPSTAPSAVGGSHKTSKPTGGSAIAPPRTIRPTQSSSALTGADPSNAPTTTAPTTTAPATTAPARPSSAPSTTAPSKPNPYSPVQVCGSGYQVIDSAPLTKGGTTQATVYLLYNSGNGDNCTVTMKKTAVGVRTTVSASLQLQGHSGKTDSGAYADYAGPVRASASGVCVKWGGSAGGVSYTSPYEHCG